MTGELRVAELERKLAARDRTIAALCDRVERWFGDETGELGTLLRMTRLEQIVAHRTQELALQKSELETAVHDLRTTQDQLVQAQKLEAVGQLAAGVAHEINTPMQYIGDNARFLEKAFLELLAALPLVAEAELEPGRRRRVALLRERVPRALAATAEGIAAVTKIVRAMKEFSHPGHGEREAFDLNETVEAMVTVSRNEWKYTATVDLDLAPNLPPVNGFRCELNQVLLNILVNAAHAVVAAHPAEAGGALRGRIVITTRADELGVRVTIRDNGTGIPAAIRSRIFDPFFTTKPVGMGTGQGLAIARSIVCDRHAGSLEVISNDDADSPDRGTTMVITLPTSITKTSSQLRVIP